MAQSIITLAFETYKAQQEATSTPVELNEFVLALVPNQDPSQPIDRNEALPPQEQIVYTAEVSQNGFVNPNAVVYSLIMDTRVGDFDFNWVGLRNKESGVLAAILHIPTIQKFKSVVGVQNGNSVTRSILMSYEGAQQATGITVDASTWQIDFTARLSGMDESARLANEDVYGHSAFLADGFQVEKSGEQYIAKAGRGYVGGLRCALEKNVTLDNAVKGQHVYLDASWQGELTSQWHTVFSFKVSADELTDHIGDDGYPHFVTKIAEIKADGSVVDCRSIEGFAEYERIENAATDAEIDGKSDQKKHVKLPQLWRSLSNLLSNSHTGSRTDLAVTEKALKEGLATKSGTSHHHDDTYYKQPQVDSKLAEKLDKTAKAADSDKLDGRDGSDYIQAHYANGLEGMGVAGDTVNWIRTTSHGLLPYAAGGASSLGTSSWPFNTVHGKTLYENGETLSSKYLPIQGKAADSDKLDGLDSSDFMKKSEGGLHTRVWAGTQSANENQRYEIGRFTIDTANWASNNIIIVELFNTHYTHGGYQKYIVKWGYGQSHAVVELVEAFGQANKEKLTVSDPVTVSGNNKYVSIFVEQTNYNRCAVKLTTAFMPVGANPPGISQCYLFEDLPKTVIPSFSAVETVVNERNQQFNGEVNLHQNLTVNNHGLGVVGLYHSERFQNVFSMGLSSDGSTRYTMSADGVRLHNFYGIGWAHSNNPDPEAKKISGHHAIFCSAGKTKSAIGDHIWTSGDMYEQNQKLSSRYVKASGPMASYDVDNVPWTSNTGVYTGTYPGAGSLVAQFKGGGSTPAAQIRFNYRNGGMWIKSARDLVGFEENWTQVFTDKHPPKVSDIEGALTKYDTILSSKQVLIEDTRGVSRLPNYYPDRYVSWDFQNRDDTGAGGDPWNAVHTIAKWLSYAHAHRQEQIAYTGDRVKHRIATSETSWGGWKSFAYTDDLAKACPVGVPLPWPHEIPPEGFVECSGNSFVKSAYPELAKVYPSGYLPNLRGEFIRGWDNKRGVDPGRDIMSEQADEFKTHSHAINRRWYNERSGGSYVWGINGSSGNSNVKTGEEGGTETRPRNIAFMYIVRAA
ncbi:phage tail protein [Vibrio sp. Of7-15]|uniref:phage tail-collar fiber domain-containing protein n=1 Tax=Vibrio sp. Of7-15 TaxID=2724879 RepID=UPI001EF34441|nr:phage tail protein [Vibrio sp. Of7-15]MCG7497749.1 phage tail protein [Vibrio sp. Of7-15]